jgi:universal stress protein E
LKDEKCTTAGLGFPSSGEIIYENFAGENMMKRILVIADQQENEQVAFFKAIEFAQKKNATIHVAIFCYESRAVMEQYEINQGELDLRAKLTGYKEQWWDQFVQTHQSVPDISQEVVWEKHIHSWVIKHCQTSHYDLIIKTGNRSETPFYTPTDWLLFRESTVPVYVVAKKHFKPKKVILVALDALAKSQEKQQLNKQLIEHALQLSVQTDAVLHCAYVIKIPTLLKDLDLIDNNAYIRKATSKAKEKLGALLEGFDISSECVHIEHGEPWGALSNLIKKLHAQCLVVGSMGRSGITGKLIGNTAERIIHIASTDLLVISPEVRPLQGR